MLPRPTTRKGSGPNGKASTARTLNRYPRGVGDVCKPSDAIGTWRASCLAANASQCPSCCAGGAGCIALDAVSGTVAMAAEPLAKAPTPAPAPSSFVEFFFVSLAASRGLFIVSTSRLAVFPRNTAWIFSAASSSSFSSAAFAAAAAASASALALAAATMASASLVAALGSTPASSAMRSLLCAWTSVSVVATRKSVPSRPR